MSGILSELRLGDYSLVSGSSWRCAPASDMQRLSIVSRKDNNIKLNHDALCAYNSHALICLYMFSLIV